MLLALALAALALTSSAHALAPHAADRGFVEGANHHLGDASFIARFGRPPGPGDSEALRMHTHLVYVRDWLAARPATRPELAPRRALILAHLDAYIQKGTTPDNLHLPWRNPVFVDDHGNVCAVGALIEATPELGGGRALVERIAALHRYDYLEDIDVPELAAWVAGSGFTLLELASIQPGYQGPAVLHWRSWEDLEAAPADGPWNEETPLEVTTGAWKDGHMHGHWERRDLQGRLLGSGDLVRGRGTWTSFYPSGATLARGPFVQDRPSGRWTFWFERGALEARGSFAKGKRDGAWTFYHDRARPVVLASGTFADGDVAGRWRHHDLDGRLLATTSRSVIDWNVSWHLETPTIAGVRLRVDQGNFGGDFARLDRLSGRFAGRELVVYRLPEWNDETGRHDLRPFDEDGHALVREPDGWTRVGCGWPAAARRAAARGAVHTLGFDPSATETDVPCPPRVPVDAATSAGLDTLLGPPDDPRPWPALLLTVADNMAWYAEWPHIDSLFERVFATLADRHPPEMF